MVTIMSWTEQVVAVLPTGTGKSLLFVLPCTFPEASQKSRYANTRERNMSVTGASGMRKFMTEDIDHASYVNAN
jgi:hypothetical protein